ncbi:hypothetical protein [Actinoplanes sp. G11-F43]|uniref:hypothetical protein n=1 Tax=Actinoplanes sp. G11-F43 TaxID=3424130 RepID=UPI003D34E64F
MTGFDTAAELRVRAGDRERTWEFLRLFTAAWGLAAGPAPMPRVEGMPVALREAYTIGGVLDPAWLDRDGDVLVFHGADQTVTDTLWGVRAEERDHPDPPVVINTGSGWQPYLDRVSLACVDIAMTAVVQDEEGRLCNAAELSPELAGPVVAAFDRVPLPDLPMWIEAEASPVRWYSGPGQLLRAHGPDWVWLWVSAQDQAALDGIYAVVPPGEWSC